MVQLQLPIVERNHSVPVRTRDKVEVILDIGVVNDPLHVFVNRPINHHVKVKDSEHVIFRVMSQDIVVVDEP